jgi:acetyl esterase/lipase
VHEEEIMKGIKRENGMKDTWGALLSVAEERTGAAKSGVVARVSRLVAAILLSLSVIACGGAGRGEDAGKESGIDLRKNIVYSTRGDRELKLDLAIPSKGKGPFPVIVFIHKGLWFESTGGAKGEHREGILLSARRGFAGVSANYRALEKKPSGEGYRNAFPAPFHDMQAAVRWLRRNAEEYSIDPNHIGAYGEGSGGELALLLGYVDPDDGISEDGEQEVSGKVQAVVHAEGIIDIPGTLALGEEDPMKISLRYREFAEKHVGGRQVANEELFRKASPVTYINEGDAPTLTLQGKLATWAPIQVTESFDRKIRRAGVEHTFVLRPNLGNRLSDLWNRQKDFPVWDFFDTHLKP